MKKGFTVVELLLSMGILTVLMTIIMRVFIEIVETRLTAESGAALTADSRYIQVRLASDLSRASAVEMPGAPGETGGTMELTIEGESYTYGLTGDNLTLTRAGETAQLNSAGTRVSGVSFVRRGGDAGVQTVSWELTLTSTTERVSGAVSTQIRGTGGTR